MPGTRPMVAGPDLPILAVVREVEETLGQPWTVEAMAARAGLSASRFAHRFRDTVGEAPLEYLLRLRLERAALHLRYADWPITDIALAAGFHSHAGFTHAFTARFRCPPSRFRERHRAEPFLRCAPGGARALPPRGAAPDVAPGGRRVTVAERPTLRVAFLRQWGGLLPLPRVWYRLSEWARSRGLTGLHAQPIGINFDEFVITPLDRARYEAGIVVPPDFDPRGEVAIRELPGGLVAELPFRGALLGFGQAWTWLACTWLGRSGYQPRTLYGYDRHPAALLGRSRLNLAARLSLDIRSTLCIPVQPGNADPVPAWAGFADERRR